MFTCLVEDITGAGIGFTIWRVDGNITTQCWVEHDGSSGSVTCGPNGVFTATLQPGGNLTHYTSTFTVTATVGLNRADVQCVSKTTFEASVQVIGESVNVV